MKGYVNIMCVVNYVCFRTYETGFTILQFDNKKAYRSKLSSWNVRASVGFASLVEHDL